MLERLRAYLLDTALGCCRPGNMNIAATPPNQKYGLDVISNK
jgi:hypothetical protein